MTNVGAFDNDGSDNFRIYGTNNLYLRANGENGGGLSIDSANQDVTIDNNLIVSGNLTVQGTTTTVNSTEVNVQNAFVFEGITADDFETTLTVTDPTADRTITLPDATGTVVLADATQTLTNKTINGDLIFEGTTADEFETTLTVVDPTADRTITLPDSTGTVLLDSSTFGYPEDFGSITGSASTFPIGTESDLGALTGDTLVGLVKDFGIIDSYISLTELKAVVSASTDFADFKTRIANL